MEVGTLAAVLLVPIPGSAATGGLTGVGSADGPGCSLEDIVTINGANVLDDTWVFVVTATRPCGFAGIGVFHGAYNPSTGGCINNPGVGKFCIYTPIPRTLSPTSVNFWVSLVPSSTNSLSGSATVTRV